MARLINPVMMLLALALSGCTAATRPRILPVLAAKQAPLMALSPLPSVKTISSAGLSEIEILDSRPESERLYYPGLSEPRHWRDAVTMLPAEAFDPSIISHIEAGLSARHIPAARVQVDLKSFQFVFDRRQDSLRNSEANRDELTERRDRRDEARRLSELEDNRRESEARSSGMAAPWQNDDAEDANVFEEILGAMLAGMFRFLGRAGSDAVLYSDLQQQSPDFITDDSHDGLNCHLDAVVRLEDSRGTPRSVTVRVRRNELYDPLVPLQPQVTDLVEAAIREFCDQVDAETTATAAAE